MLILIHPQPHSPGIFSPTDKRDGHERPVVAFSRHLFTHSHATQVHWIRPATPVKLAYASQRPLPVQAQSAWLYASWGIITPVHADVVFKAWDA
jgi:hypothetical protein